MLTTALLLASGGCASSTPTNSLEAHQNNVIRRMAIECYWQNEGLRVVHGDLRIYTSCRHWARRQVQVSMPAASALPER
jgi:hypothetical protein